MFCCFSSSINDSETDWTNDVITMATTDSATTHVEPIDTTDSVYQSVVSRSRDNDIQTCLQRMLALS